MTLSVRFTQALDEILEKTPAAQIGVAVSGGGDSTALLQLLAGYAQKNPVSLRAVTVDHGLRNEAAAEADAVAEHCAKLGIKHDILTWTGWDGTGNTQDQARRARYGLIVGWAAEQGITHVALGHTQDDQAETMLMRLARGSGVDGLSAMAAARAIGGVTWLRPMLAISRAELRDYMRAQGLSWAEDPSNDNPKYDRVKFRAALDVLDGLGISRAGLADTASRLGSARRVLEQVAMDDAKRLASVKVGAVEIDLKGFFQLADETRRRLLAHTLCWVATEDYPPRHTALLALESAMAQNKTTTLHGCLITARTDSVTVSRELAAVADLAAATDAIWDQRWQMSGPARPKQTIRATSENGLKYCPDWRETGLSRQVLSVTPAIWENDTLIAAPLAGLTNGWCAELRHSENHFFTSVLSH